MAFRGYLGKFLDPVMFIILLAAVFLVIFLPLALRMNLLAPLETLLEGVRKANDARLEAPIPVAYNDEIGFLTSSFNQMYVRLDELVHSLEAKVEARTADLVAANERLERLSITDPLTGIYNRRHFFTQAHDIFTRAKQPPYHLSLIMLDMDHFKLINDRYGHAIGDQVLCEVARRLKDNIRTTDILARFGGEEFVILFPRISRLEALQIVERLHQAMSQAFTPANGLAANHVVIPLSLSIGVALLDQDVKDLDQLLQRADQALYRAKENGRNCWMLWDEQMGG
jgi:diguanylate cyclase (GGDEF)-like protein